MLKRQNERQKTNLPEITGKGRQVQNGLRRALASSEGDTSTDLHGEKMHSTQHGYHEPSEGRRASDSRSSRSLDISNGGRGEGKMDVVGMSKYRKIGKTGYDTSKRRG